MPPSRKPLEIDSGRIFRGAFLATFLTLSWLFWLRIGRWLAFVPRHRVPVFRLAFRSMWSAAVGASLLAGVTTLAATLLTRLILAPLLDRWLRPAFDPSSWMFHLAAGETPTATMPARWKSGGRSRPGALVLTGRRIWFMPSAWDLEPWSMVRQDVERIEAAPPAVARVLPVQHWPDLLRFTARSGDHAWFAVADPGAVLAWFGPSRRPDAASPSPRVAPQGVFDV
jgi:hypothetical protein